MGCIAYHKLRGSSSTVQTLGINCLLLTTNNTGVGHVVSSSWLLSAVLWARTGLL
jgi:hypothetical protein